MPHALKGSAFVAENLWDIRIRQSAILLCIRQVCAELDCDNKRIRFLESPTV